MLASGKDICIVETKEKWIGRSIRVLRYLENIVCVSISIKVVLYLLNVISHGKGDAFRALNRKGDAEVLYYDING